MFWLNFSDLLMLTVYRLLVLVVDSSAPIYTTRRGESLPSSDGFPSLPLSLVVPVIRADLQ